MNPLPDWMTAEIYTAPLGPTLKQIEEVLNAPKANGKTTALKKAEAEQAAAAKKPVVGVGKVSIAPVGTTDWVEVGTTSDLTFTPDEDDYLVKTLPSKAHFEMTYSMPKKHSLASSLASYGQYPPVGTPDSHFGVMHPSTRFQIHQKQMQVPQYDSYFGDSYGKYPAYGGPGYKVVTVTEMMIGAEHPAQTEHLKVEVDPYHVGSDVPLILATQEETKAFARLLYGSDGPLEIGLAKTFTESVVFKEYVRKRQCSVFIWLVDHFRIRMRWNKKSVFHPDNLHP